MTDEPRDIAPDIADDLIPRRFVRVRLVGERRYRYIEVTKDDGRILGGFEVHKDGTYAEAKVKDGYSRHLIYGTRADYADIQEYRQSKRYGTLVHLESREIAE